MEVATSLGIVPDFQIASAHIHIFRAEIISSVKTIFLFPGIEFHEGYT